MFFAKLSSLNADIKLFNTKISVLFHLIEKSKNLNFSFLSESSKGWSAISSGSSKKIENLINFFIRLLIIMEATGKFSFLKLFQKDNPVFF